MIESADIRIVRLVHGSFNFLVVLLFFIQGMLGLKIRKARRAGAASPSAALRRHRKAGPVLAVLGTAGFFAGLGIGIFSDGGVLEYPLHLGVGVSIVVLITSLFFVSRKIRSGESPWRQRHFVLGLCLLVLYVVQVLLGLGILAG